MVVALSGWVDAGGRRRGRDRRALREQLATPTSSRRSISTDHMDLQQTRPNAHWADDGDRVIDWPEITFVGRGRGSAATSCSSPGPSRRCAGRRVAPRSSRSRARLRRARRPCTVGGMPALVSHRRPGSGARDRDAPFARAGDRAAAARRTAARPGCRRSCSARSATPASAARGLWAQVPQYVVGLAVAARGPRAARRLAEIGRLELDLRPLDDALRGVPAPGRRRARDPARGAGGRRPHRPRAGRVDRRPRLRDRAVPAPAAAAT